MPFTTSNYTFCVFCGSSRPHKCILTNNSLSSMMTSSNGDIFRVIGPLSSDVFFNLRLNKRLRSREAGDRRCHRAHHVVTVMSLSAGIQVRELSIIVLRNDLKINGLFKPVRSGTMIISYQNRLAEPTMRSRNGYGILQILSHHQCRIYPTKICHFRQRANMWMPCKYLMPPLGVAYQHWLTWIPA